MEAAKEEGKLDQKVDMGMGKAAMVECGRRWGRRNNWGDLEGIVIVVWHEAKS